MAKQYDKQLKDYGIKWTHKFSVYDHLIETGTNIVGEIQFPDGTIQKKFEDTRPLPANAEVQNEEFNKLMDVFNEGKVEYLVSARQKEDENLMIKLAILDKMESIIKTISKGTKDWVNVEKEIEGLSTQWKKVGRVIKEKSDEAWERYKSLRDQYFGLKMEFNTEYRGELEKNLKIGKHKEYLKGEP